MASAALQPGSLIQGNSKQIKSKVAKVTDSPPPEVTEFGSQGPEKTTRPYIMDNNYVAAPKINTKNVTTTRSVASLVRQDGRTTLRTDSKASVEYGDPVLDSALALGEVVVHP